VGTGNDLLEHSGEKSLYVWAGLFFGIKRRKELSEKIKTIVNSFAILPEDSKRFNKAVKEAGTTKSHVIQNFIKIYCELPLRERKILNELGVKNFIKICDWRKGE
jgi:hypothetical protein